MTEMTIIEEKILETTTEASIQETILSKEEITSIMEIENLEIIMVTGTLAITETNSKETITSIEMIDSKIIINQEMVTDKIIKMVKTIDLIMAIMVIIKITVIITDLTEITVITMALTEIIIVIIMALTGTTMVVSTGDH